MLEKASQEPNTLTGRIASQLVKEPRGVRVMASAGVVLLLVLSIVVFVHRSGGEDTAYKAAVAANSVQAWQDYLKVCKGCPHEAAAQAALDKLQKAQAAVALEAQFKELLAKQLLVPPASPNASDVLKQLQESAPDDAFIPQAQADLAAALKVEDKRAAPAAPPQAAAKPVAAPVRKVLPKKTVKAPKPAAKTAATKPVIKAPAQAANEVMPKLLSGPAPKYPSGIKDKVSGWVELEFTVNVDGSTSSVDVVDSNPKGLFEDAAMHAVHGWVFSPYTLDGERQRKRIRWRIEFKP